MTVLVAAASKHDATWEIAQAIGHALEVKGFGVDVRRADEVHDVTSYDAAVLGSAVYMGKWLATARRLVEDHAAELSARPTWLFSSGPIGSPPKPDEEQAVDVDAIVAQAGAREHRLFAGRLDRSGLGLAERAVVRAFRAPDGDFRDWAEVESWADGIAAALRA